MLKQVTLSIESPSPFRELAQKHNSKITVVECRDLEAHGMVLLLEMDGSDKCELMKDLQAIPGVKHVYWSTDDAKNTLAMVTMDTPFFCEIAKLSGALCRSCPLNVSDYEEGEWRLMVKDVSSLKGCIEMLERHGHRVEITEVSNAIHRYLLTPRQKEIVREAIRLGYFDFPRKIDLTELARRLSVKPSTLSEILRRAEGKIAKYYLESDAT
jgi:predicted DNA binding protein